MVPGVPSRVLALTTAALMLAVLAPVPAPGPLGPAAAAAPGSLPAFDPDRGLGGSAASWLGEPGQRAGPSLLARPPPMPPPQDGEGPGTDADSPGSARGVNTNENTLGFTTIGGDLDRWVWDTESTPLEFEVNMGKLVNKGKIAAEKDYIFEYAFNVVGWFWFDGDGVFDPVPNQNSNGVGDDPCPKEPFKIFDFRVEDRLVRTVEGHKTTLCAPGGPETSRSFEIKPDPAYPDDPPYWIRIPKDALKEGRNKVAITLYDFRTQLPAASPHHSSSSDGWEMYIDWAAIELAAPPLVLSHGWTYEWNPGPVNVNQHWLSNLKGNIRSAFLDHTGQDPWRWAWDTPLGGGIWMNTYDRKQDFRKSARELLVTVNGVHSLLGYEGKGWMHGHSMGGLVSRWYVEKLNGFDKIDRLAFTATPHLGSYAAHLYTFGFWLLYEADDEDYTARWFNLVPFLGPKVWAGWRDWWNIGAWEWRDGPGHGPDHLADFMLKPGNPLLGELNAAFPAPGVDYFVVRGDWSPAIDLTRFIIPGDVVVTLDSAILGGRITKFRTLDEQHEEVPNRTESAVWLFRHFTNVDLDTGLPNSGGASGSFGLAEVAASPPAEPGGLFRADAAGTMVFLGPDDVAEGPYEHPCTVDDVAHAGLGVLVHPNEGPLDLAVEAPDGTVYGPDDVGEVPGLTYTDLLAGPFRFLLFGLPDPAPGTWTLRVRPVDVPPAEGVPVYVTCALDSPVSLRAAPDLARYLPGQTATLTATLADGAAPLAGATVVATRATADGAETLELFDDGAHGDGAAGDGVYGVAFDVGEDEATHRFEVRATGTGSTGAFERTATLDVVVAAFPDLAVAAADLAGSPPDAWGGDAVELTATVRSEGERAARGGFGVSFYDGAPGQGGILLGRVASEADLPVGEARAVTLATSAPGHALNLHVVLDTVDLDADPANDRASAPMPFVPTPRTAATVEGPAGLDGWLMGPARVTLGPFDGTPAGYAQTTYRLDGGPDTPYAGPFQVAEDGDHALEFWSVDAASRTEPVRTARVKVDTAAPLASLRNPQAHSLHALDLAVPNPQGTTFVAGLVDVAVRASDATSGVARVRLAVDGLPAGSAAPGDDGDWHLLWDSTTASNGYHTLTYTVQDAAGHTVGGAQRVYVLASRTVQVDTDPNATVARLRPGVD